MNDKTTDQMIEELKADGWHCGGYDNLVYKGDVTYDTVHNDGGLTAVEQAYAHLQEQRKLKALEALALRIEYDFQWWAGTDHASDWYDEDAVETYEALKELIKQYNIIADERDDATE